MEFVKDVGTTKNLGETILQYYPNIKSKSESALFHKSVQEFFKIRRTDSDGLLALKIFYQKYSELYPNIKTRKKYLSEIRKIIKENQSAELYTKSTYDKYFNINKKQRTEIIQEYNKSIRASNNDKIQIDASMILNKMEELISSSNPYERALALLLAYGGRPIELFTRNTFDYKEPQGSWLTVNNLAKKRNKQESSIDRPIILFTPEQFIKEVGRLRNDFKNKILETDGVFAKDKSATLNKYAVKHFQFLEDVHQKSSMMRKIYADLAYHTYADKSKQNKNSFIGQILGHNDLLTSFSYSWVNLHGSKPDENLKIQELEKKINMLSLQNRVPVPKTKISRRAPKTEKIALLEKLYGQGFTKNTALRKASGLGSAIVNSFLKSKKN
jgi:hypothetical protein